VPVASIRRNLAPSLALARAMVPRMSTTLTAPSPILRLSLPLLAVAGTVAGFFAITAVADDEARRAPATCAATGCYCEAVAPVGVRQSVDAWSSLAPAIGGAVVLFFAFGPRPRGGVALTQSRLPGTMLALAACSIAIFSFHYHATLTWLGEWLDGVALYLLAGFGLAWTVAHQRKLGPWGFAAVYLGLAAVPALVTLAVPGLRKVAFIAIVVAAIGVELVWRHRRGTVMKTGWLILAVGCFALAATAWLLDWFRVVCDPHGPFQLHAMWHGLSAPVVVGIDRYYASERPAPRPAD